MTAWEREFFTVDEIAEAQELAIAMNGLYDVMARLDAAREAHAWVKAQGGRSRAAMAAKAAAFDKVSALRRERDATIVALGPALRVRELAAITRMASSQVSQTLRHAESPVPRHPRGGRDWRPRAR